MPAHEVPRHELTELLEITFASLVEQGEVDVVADLAPSEFEVQADEWTLHLEGWPLAAGFLVLDDEPTSDVERRNALDAALDSSHLAAMRQLNRSTDGAIAAVLVDSGDPISTLLAILLAESDSQDLLDSLDEPPGLPVQ